MPEGFRGKVAIVTGASSGIGRATALALAREGASLALAARNQRALEAVEEEARSLGVETLVVPTDVARREDVRALVQRTLERFGRVDVFVSGAGVGAGVDYRCPVRDLQVEDVERVMAVNFYGPLYGILEVLPHLLERRSGHVVVVSSMDGKKGLPPDGAYAASKFAIGGLVEVLRQELRGTGVSVTTVFPGRVDTPMIEGIDVPRISAKLPPEQVARAILDGIRKRRGEVLIPYVGAKALVLLNAISSDIGDWAVRLFRLSGRERQRSGDKR